MNRKTKWTTTSLEPRWMLAADAGAAVDVATNPAIESSPISGDSDISRICAATHQASTETPVIVFVDGSLNDLETLTDDVAGRAEIVLLDPSQTLIGQISKHLESRTNVSSIHLITHGTSGGLIFGNEVVSAESLRQSARDIKQWNFSLTADADILVYGCDTARGEAGEKFIDILSALSGADVAASIDRTGAETRGANWTLEFTVGNIESAIIVSHRASEAFRNTLNIVVNAQGEIGDESFQVLIHDEVIGTFTASNAMQEYTVELSEPVSADQVSVRFINDLYDPAAGIDRNLIVDNVVIDGVTHETEDPTTYSTGTWLPEDGPTPGFGRGETLNTNGSFFFGGQTTGGPLNLSGMAWQTVSESTVAQQSDDGVGLTIFPSTESAIWSYADLSAGESFTLTVDADIFGEVIPEGAKGFIGVDYFNADGVEMGEVVTEFSVADNGFTKVLRGDAPSDMAYATIWISLFTPEAEQDTELEILRVDLTAEAAPSDVTPPSARLQTDVVTIQTQTPFPSTPNFVVVFSDETSPGVPNTAIVDVTAPPVKVTSPDGSESVPIVFTGGFGPEPNEFFNVISVPEGPNGFVAGEYIVEMRPNVAFDSSGNAVPAGVIGTFTVEIIDGPVNPDDTTPPTVEVTTQTVTSDRNEFAILASDTQSRIRFWNQGDISVIGPGGNEIDVSGIAGGNGTEPNTLWELYQIRTPEISAGTYQVFIEAGYVIDESNNLNEPGLIGTFEYVQIS